MSTPPSGASRTDATLAPLSRQGRRFEWCSYGPTNTRGVPASHSGEKLSMCTRWLTAPVHPVPVKMTVSFLLSPPTHLRTMPLASARNSVVCVPVADEVVCVLA